MKTVQQEGKRNGTFRMFPIDGKNPIKFNGLTKREYFAALAMQGLVSKIDNCSSDKTALNRARDLANRAVVVADALLNSLEKNTD